MANSLQSVIQTCRNVDGQSVPRRTYNQSPDFFFPQPTLSPDKLFKYRNHKGQCFARASHRLDYDVFVIHEERDRRCLDWRHLGVAHREYYIDPELG